MSFTFKMVDRDGGELGTFTTAVPNWRVGDEVMRTPHDRLTIIETRAANDETFAGEWIVEPLTAA